MNGSYLFKKKIRKSMVAPGRMATFCIVVRKEGLFGIPQTAY